MTRIISLDPGGTTGLALFDTEKRMWARKLIGPHPHHSELYDLLGQYNPDIIVCESFEYRNESRPGLVLSSMEYIGITKLYVAHRGPTFFMQTAGAGKAGKKTFVKKENIERLGLWIPGNDENGSPWRHAMDATAHLLFFMIHNPAFVRIDPRVTPLIKTEYLRKGWR